ncbi:MAG TPA: hypothetical protein ENJ41_01660 [Oceanospirillales bacterium]|nr:hypothetical protein [Oceanospirillales bacterium]
MNKRPAGISIIAVIFILIGFSLMMQLFNANTESYLTLSTSFIIFYALSIGLIRGLKWAWWLTAVVLMILTLADSVNIIASAQMSTAQVRAFPKKLAQFAFHGLMLFYLFQRNVTQYFQLENRDTWKNPAIVFAVSIALVLLYLLVLKVLI